MSASQTPLPHKDVRRPRLAAPWTFLLLTLGWSWLWQFPVAFAGWEGSTPPAIAVRIIGGVGPALFGLGLLYLAHGESDRRDYWRRLLDVRRIGAAWWLAILLLKPTLELLAAAGDLLTGGSGLGLAAAATILEDPLQLVPLAIFILFFGPLPEELGWRGYGLDRLQTRYNPAAASLLLGLVWALWHLPLCVMAGTPQAEFGLLTWPFFRYMLQVVASAFVHTWVFNHTGRSTLAAVLLHFSGNAAGELFSLSANGENLLILLQLAVAGAIAIGQLRGNRSPQT
jgi:membrane protease YdiL (CAAX protease family)